jgi:hypothetical protein
MVRRKKRKAETDLSDQMDHKAESLGEEEKEAWCVHSAVTKASAGWKRKLG